MRTALLVLALVSSRAVAQAPVVAPAAPSVPTVPKEPKVARAEAAEALFFKALQENVRFRPAAISALDASFLEDARNGRIATLLGLAHLWSLFETRVTSPRRLEHAILAEHFFSRAAQLNPSDTRIPSWLVPVRLMIAEVEGRPEAIGPEIQRLVEAHAKDPVFHTVSLAIILRKSPDPADQQRVLDALRHCETCDRATQPQCRNEPRWPHNEEGFALFHADWEFQTGHRDEALKLLDHVRSLPTYANWPFKAVAEARLKSYRTGRAPRNPLISEGNGMGCRACHARTR